ncbi:MAG: hypothetical protein WKG07_29760 [Hymenobacter sp.]
MAAKKWWPTAAARCWKVQLMRTGRYYVVVAAWGIPGPARRAGTPQPAARRPRQRQDYHALPRHPPLPPVGRRLCRPPAASAGGHSAAQKHRALTMA